VPEELRSASPFEGFLPFFSTGEVSLSFPFVVVRVFGRPRKEGFSLPPPFVRFFLSGTGQTNDLLLLKRQLRFSCGQAGLSSFFSDLSLPLAVRGVPGPKSRAKFFFCVLGHPPSGRFSSLKPYFPRACKREAFLRWNGTGPHSTSPDLDSSCSPDGSF